VSHVREHQLRAEIEVAAPGVVDEEAALPGDECGDVSRALRHPGVEDQPIELRDVDALGQRWGMSLVGDGSQYFLLRGSEVFPGCIRTLDVRNVGWLALSAA
jgi:hypothetical protein